MTQNDETQIKALIANWTRAISSGDRAGILAHHSSDMLMFDFPAPLVRGIDAYDRTWDFFFDSPTGPISFTPSELEVVAGDEVAFAHCLIHCEGTSGGMIDLRLTMGLRKINGEWTVMHEHHSAPSIEERFTNPSTK